MPKPWKRYSFEEHPLKIGVAIVAVGVAAGLWLWFFSN
jgi:hypothetical protein